MTRNTLIEAVDIDIRETLESTLTSIGVLCIGFSLGAYYLGNQMLAECGFKSTQFSGAGICSYAIEATNTTTKWASVIGVVLFLVGATLTSLRGDSE